MKRLLEAPLHLLCRVHDKIHYGNILNLKSTRSPYVTSLKKLNKNLQTEYKITPCYIQHFMAHCNTSHIILSEFLDASEKKDWVATHEVILRDDSLLGDVPLARTNRDVVEISLVKLVYE